MSHDTQTDCPMTIKPQAEHDWLAQMVGEWTFEAECFMGPDQPPFKGTFRETVRALGDLWVIGESESQMPGGGVARNVITLGFDPATGRYVGTFVASPMAHLWVYDGERDATGKVLTLYTKGPSMDPATPGQMMQYKDVMEMVSDEHRILTSHVLGEDGQWAQFMTATYRRKV